LPVEFVSVTASAQPGTVTVSWTVVAEEDVRHYVVERSIDGKPFTTIGTVAYKAPTASTVEYSYLDIAPVAYKAYRIRQVDEDGSFTISPVAVVRINHSVTSLSLYPSPVQAASRIHLTAAAAQEGRNILIPPALQQLPAGTYLLSATIDRKLHAVLFIKQ
jgi:hypothetical protein